MTSRQPDSSATTGYEAELWAMADALRGSMDAAEYKHVVLGLIFLKYISDAFEERRAAVLAEWGEDAAEDRDEYVAENIFWVPREARWARLKARARQPTIGQTVDEAMSRGRARQSGAEGRAPQGLRAARTGQAAPRPAHRHGRQHPRRRCRGPFPGCAGPGSTSTSSRSSPAPRERGAASSTRRACVVRLLVEMLEPYRGRVYDPCCGSSGMFVQSVEFIRAHASGNGNGGTATGDISIYGQGSRTTRRGGLPG